MESTTSDYRIVRASAEDRDRILTFMKAHFYKFEPLVVSLGMTDGPSCQDKIFTLTSLTEGISLMALATSANGNEDIVGICLNGETSPNDAAVLGDLSNNCPCPKYSKLLKFLAIVDEGGYVWKATGVDKMLDIHVIAVDMEKRRGGLGKAMVEYTRKLAKELGYPALSMHCTSHYSARLAQKLGMQCVFEMKYDEYLDTSGCPVFHPPPPHVGLKSFVQMVE